MVAINPISVYPSYNYVMPQRKQSVANTTVEKLKRDIDRFERKVQNAETTLKKLSPIPTFRRINSVPDSIKQDNNSRALGALGLAALNFPADYKEIGLAGKEIKNVFKQGIKGFKGNPYQHEMSFFKYTLLNKLPNKIPFLQNADNTLFDTKFGQLLQNKCNLGISDFGNIKGNKSLIGYKYSGNIAQKTLARTLHRIPVIGLALSTAFEIPTLVKSITKTEGTGKDKAKAFGTQLVKSAGYIGLTTAAIGLIGAATFPVSSVLGLAGMAVGSAIGLKDSNMLNKFVDKF